MNYKSILIIILSLILYSCENNIGNNSKKINLNLEKKYRNTGFALIYNDKLKNMSQFRKGKADCYQFFKGVLLKKKLSLN